MPELERPPIDLDMTYKDTCTPQMQIARDLLGILKLRYTFTDSVVGDMCVTTKISQRTDMGSSDPNKEVALRVVMNPVMATTTEDFDDLHPSSNYLVTTLEYGVLNDPDNALAATDDFFDWKPYVTTIVSAESDGDDGASVVNSQNGEDLNEMELYELSVLLEAFRRETAAYLLVDTQEDDFGEADYSEISPMSARNVTAQELARELYSPVSCDACIENEVQCTHPSANPIAN